MPVYVVLELPTEEEAEGGTSDGVFYKTRDAVEGLMRAKGSIVSEHDASLARTAATIAVGFVPTAFHLEGKAWNVEREIDTPFGPAHPVNVFTEIPDDEEEKSDG